MKTLSSVLFPSALPLLATPAFSEEPPAKLTVTRSRPAATLLARAARAPLPLESQVGGAASDEPSIAVEIGLAEESPTKPTVGRARYARASSPAELAASPSWRNSGSKPVLWRLPASAP